MASGLTVSSITVVERKRNLFEIQLARFDLREVEDVVEDRQQRFSRRSNGRQTLDLIGRQLGIERQLRHPDDPVHRRPDFVAHVREELALGHVRGFGGFLGGRQFLGHQLPRGRVAADAHEPDDGARGVFSQADRFLHEPLRAVLRDERVLERLQRLAGAIHVVIVPEEELDGFRIEELLVALADELVARVAGGAAERVVDVLVPALAAQIDFEISVLDPLENRAVALLAQPQLFCREAPIRAVAPDADEADGIAPSRPVSG